MKIDRTAYQHSNQFMFKQTILVKILLQNHQIQPSRKFLERSIDMVGSMSFLYAQKNDKLKNENVSHRYALLYSAASLLSIRSFFLSHKPRVNCLIIRILIKDAYRHFTCFFFFYSANLRQCLMEQHKLFMYKLHRGSCMKQQAIAHHVMQVFFTELDFLLKKNIDFCLGRIPTIRNFMVRCTLLHSLFPSWSYLFTSYARTKLS